MVTAELVKELRDRTGAGKDHTENKTETAGIVAIK